MTRFFPMTFLFTCNISLVWWEIFLLELQALNIYYSSSKEDQKFKIEYVMWTCLELWPMKNTYRKIYANESLIMACLQIHREFLSLATFLWVHSNSEEVSYLSWQNTYPKLKTTCHIKLIFFSCELNS